MKAQSPHYSKLKHYWLQPRFYRSSSFKNTIFSLHNSLNINFSPKYRVSKKNKVINNTGRKQSFKTLRLVTLIIMTLRIMTQHNEIQRNDTQHYEIQHNDSQHNEIQHDE